MTTEKIPLNKLIPGKANVRKTGAKTGIEELAANIKALGLLQNLQVRPAEDGKYAVEAGRRRLFALKLLAKQKHIAKDEEIDCRILAEGEDATEVSLAENVMRLPMHPADQFEAFKALADAGKGPEDIAARFGCAPSTVRQRMRLATVSPKLLAIYRDEGMTLDQLMAFTVSDDHEAQVTVWRELPQWNRQPETIRRNLTRQHVEATSARAVFVGLETYLAAGGGIIRDLFAEQHPGYLTDGALLEKLAAERLEREAETVRAEGWKWVEILAEPDPSVFRGFGHVYPERHPLTPEQEEEVARLSDAHDAIVEEYGDEDLPEDKARELETITDRIDAFSRGTRSWNPEDVARAGAVLAIGYGGRLDVERGLVRPEDMPEREKRPEAAPHPRSGDKEGKPEASELPAPLVEDLTAHRTAALRAVLAHDPDAALTAVVHALALPLFYRYGAKSCLDIRVSSEALSGSADGIDNGPAARLLADRHAYWQQELPVIAEGLWNWLLTRDMAQRLELLAYCAGCSVNAVVKRQERADERITHADFLAAAIGLDMTQWWQPTKASYLARVSKARALEAVAEGVSQSAAENLAKLKKDDLAKLAEERLAETGWLPALLRTPRQRAEAEEQPEAQAA